MFKVNYTDTRATSFHIVELSLRTDFILKMTFNFLQVGSFRLFDRNTSWNWNFNFLNIVWNKRTESYNLAIKLKIFTFFFFCFWWAFLNFEKFHFQFCYDMQSFCPLRAVHSRIMSISFQFNLGLWWLQSGCENDYVMFTELNLI